MSTILDDVQASRIYPGLGSEPLHDRKDWTIRRDQGFSLSVFTRECEEVTVYLNDRVFVWKQGDPRPINIDENLSNEFAQGENIVVVTVINYSYHIDLELVVTAGGQPDFRPRINRKADRRSGLVYLGVFTVNVTDEPPPG